MEGQSIQRLIDGLGAADSKLRSQSVAQLVALRGEAVPRLRKATESPDPEIRMLAFRALHEIGDPACAMVFKHALDDVDERIRAYAAQGLARIADPQAMEALIATLNDFPDVLRQPSTPATDTLTEMGPRVLPKMVELLKSDAPMTRMRAFLVIRNVVTPDLRQGGWEMLWQQLGEYDALATKEKRQPAVQRWHNWIAQCYPVRHR